MSSKQERELEMRNTMLVKFAMVVHRAKEFVERQTSDDGKLDREFEAGLAFDEWSALTGELAALQKHDWARAILESIERDLASKAPS